jgi:malonate-semialdehyde dehydrogenase (acetylating)/methylmalonate-semialdehyde dehydrogenase
MTTTVNHWIDNKEFISTSGRTAPVYDPALGVETKRVALANGAEINAAIAAAKKAFPGWSKTSLAARQQVIFKFRELLNAKKGGSLRNLSTEIHPRYFID